MKKIFIAFLLVLSSVVSAETYYQNTNNYPVDVPTDTGSIIQVPPGKFVGGVYYQVLADLKILTIWAGIPATPTASDLVYTYNSTKALDALLPDQTTANGKFLKSVLGHALWDSITATAVLPDQSAANTKFLQSVNGTATWNALPVAVVPGADTQLIFNDAGTLAGDAGITYNKTTDSLSLVGKVTAVGFQLTSQADPTCDIATRGQFWFLEGGAGVKDSVMVCGKDAGDAYAWRTVY